MRERGTPRQLGVVLFVALLAPASSLPHVLAGAGPLSWLAPLLAAPLGAFVIWRLGKLGNRGLGQRMTGPLGGALLTLYYLWASALCALTAGGCVDRLRRTDYGQAPAWLLSLALTAVAAYLILRGGGAFLRAVEIFFLALAAVLALVFVLGAAHLEPANLAPTGWGDIRGAVLGIGPAASALAVGTLAAFFPRQDHQPGGSRVWRWAVGWCGVAAGLCLVVGGTLGCRLAARAPLPFFLALQGLGFPGGFRRLEALCTAAWALSDLALLGLAALAARQMAGGKALWAAPPLVCAFLGGCLLPNAAAAKVAPLFFGINLALGGIVPVLLSVFRPRGREET